MFLSLAQRMWINFETFARFDLWPDDLVERISALRASNARYGCVRARLRMEMLLLEHKLTLTVKNV